MNALLFLHSVSSQMSQIDAQILGFYLFIHPSNRFHSPGKGCPLNSNKKYLFILSSQLLSKDQSLSRK